MKRLSINRFLEGREDVVRKKVKRVNDDVVESVQLERKKERK